MHSCCCLVLTGGSRHKARLTELKRRMTEMAMRVNTALLDKWETSSVPGKRRAVTHYTVTQQFTFSDQLQCIINAKFLHCNNDYTRLQLVGWASAFRVLCFIIIIINEFQRDASLETKLQGRYVSRITLQL